MLFWIIESPLACADIVDEEIARAGRDHRAATDGAAEYECAQGFVANAQFCVAHIESLEDDHGLIAVFEDYGSAALKTGFGADDAADVAADVQRAFDVESAAGGKVDGCPAGIDCGLNGGGVVVLVLLVRTVAFGIGPLRQVVPGDLGRVLDGQIQGTFGRRKEA